MAKAPDPKPRGFSTICLPIRPERYQQLIGAMRSSTLDFPTSSST